MLNKEVFEFLKLLGKNNNREWFKENKHLHDQSKKTVEEFSNSLFDVLKTDNNLDYVKVFRIYRDIRFSKNKTPYKNHFGIAFHRTKPLFRGGYYLHIEPKNSFLATGFWDPNKEDLFRIRKEIESDYSEFKSVVENKSITSSWDNLKGEQLKTAPKGFAKDHPGIKYLRYKQLIYSQKIDDAAFLQPSFETWITNEFKLILPFVDYLSEILTTDLNGESLF